MTKKKIVNYQLAKKVALAAISAKDQRLPPFDREDLFPDAIVPNNMSKGSQEHSLFLFHSISIDSMRQAEKVYSAMREITQELGSLKELAHMKKARLEGLLIPHFGEGVTKPKNSMTDPVGTILYNAKKLEKECASDPRTLKKRGVKTTLKIIDDFRQYGIPKAALLMKNYVRSGIWPFGEHEIPIKVDRHVLRINIGCGVIDVEPHIEVINKDRKLSKALTEAKEQLIRIGHYTEKDFEQGRVRMVRGSKFIDALTDTYLRVTKNTGISAIDLDDAFWAKGANSCKFNDAIYCDAYCTIPCKIRHPSDNNAVYFFIDIDKRKNIENIFKVVA